MASKRSNVVEVLELHLPRRLTGDVDAAPARGFLRAGVGRLALMPIAHAGRVDLEQMGHARLLGDLPEHALGHGRAADIAETDKQQTVLRHGGSFAWADGLRKPDPRLARR